MTIRLRFHVPDLPLVDREAIEKARLVEKPDRNVQVIAKVGEILRDTLPDRWPSWSAVAVVPTSTVVYRRRPQHLT